MAGKSKINIFNVMDEDELKEEIKRFKGFVQNFVV